MNLSKNFTLEEFTISEIAGRKGIVNEPTEKHILALEALCKHTLQLLRNRLMRPIVITSGYRSPELNTAIGGSSRSQHCKGEAVDFFVPGMPIPLVIDVIRSMHLPFDQLIDEFGRWVHMSHKLSGKQRGTTLLARKSGMKTFYSPF